MSEPGVVCVFEQGYVDREGNLIWVDEVRNASPIEARLEALEEQMLELQRTVDNLVETLRQAMGR